MAKKLQNKIADEEESGESQGTDNEELDEQNNDRYANLPKNMADEADKLDKQRSQRDIGNSGKS